MRSFQLFFIALFLIFYIVVSFGAIKGLLRITSTPNRKKVFWIIFIISLAVLISFILLYIWPLTTRNTKEYTMHLIFNALLSIDFVFRLPLALSILIGIPFSVKRKTVIYSIGFLLSIATASSILYGTLLGRKDLVVNQLELAFAGLPKNFDGLKILQISDIHLGGFMNSKELISKVKTETNKINPDIVLFTGDLVNNFSNELNDWDTIFQEITYKRACYSILGNHDYGNYTNWKNDSSKIENFNQINSSHKSFGFKLLNNEHIQLKLGNDSIFIVGVENWGHPPFPQYANLEKAMNGIPTQSFKILMTHDPSHWDQLIKHRSDIDLTLSGHTHGMQWGIIKAGITFSLSYFVRNNWGGLYNYNNSYLYVNSGLGTVGIPWRINMPGEITVITLKRIEID
jgi:uncharacterized protein